jgi:glycopeptide antibiotics resistance protein
VVAAVTLTPLEGGGQYLNTVLGRDVGLTPASLANVLGNVALFVPLGALAVPALPRARPALLVLLAAGTSAAIEVAQWTAHLGRATDVNDVAANVAGAALGVVAVVAARAGRVRGVR